MIQYNHFNQMGTLFIKTPTKEELISLVANHKNSIAIEAGLAVKYHTDQFNKRIGRLNAEQNTRMHQFNFTGIGTEEDKNIYYLNTVIEHNNREYSVEIVLTSVPESERVYLIDASLESNDGPLIEWELL